VVLSFIKFIKEIYTVEVSTSFRTIQYNTGQQCLYNRWYIPISIIMSCIGVDENGTNNRTKL